MRGHGTIINDTFVYNSVTDIVICDEAIVTASLDGILMVWNRKDKNLMGVMSGVR